MSGKRLRLLVVLTLLLLLVIIVLAYGKLSPKGEVVFSPPTWEHWFGTDVIGNDILLACADALLIALVTLAIVLPAIYIGGLIIGSLLSYYSSARLREFLLNLVHYWVTLPVLLMAIFLLILVGAGQANIIGILIFVLIPTQSLYVYNKMEEAKKQDFMITKSSYGFTKRYIFVHHLFPFIRNSLNIYTLSRMPEILMMDLAFNFLGLGIQLPNASFGRMLFDGLSFMFSAWWMWVFPVVFVILLFVGVNLIAKVAIEHGRLLINGGWHGDYKRNT
ncbi:MAG: ABC transporter permease subunit [Dehalococcoidia bacterium]|nr:ABC transporter permease subunit [Dehalococcoidia bacterium]